MDNPYTHTETITTRQNLIILNDQIISLSNIKIIKKGTQINTRLERKVFNYTIEICYHNDVDKITVVYDFEEQRNTDFEDIALCLNLGDSI